MTGLLRRGEVAATGASARRRGNAPDSVVLEREAQLEIARSNHANRRAGLEKCRTVLSPTFQQIMAIGR
jgi:hypothetical protein